MTDVFASYAGGLYLRWALALLGAILLVTISQVTVVVPGEGGSSPDDIELTLGEIRTIEQIFTTTEPNLVGLRLRIRPGDPSDGVISFPIRLRYADGPPIDMLRDTIVVGSAEDGVVSIRFPPLIASRDPYLITGTLRLTLDLPEIPPNTGPLITVRKSPTEQRGLLIDGAPQPGLDLAIIPLYQRRWADTLWPISAMADGKPGLFGQPLFYVMLSYLYMLMLGEGALSLRRAQASDSGDP